MDGFEVNIDSQPVTVNIGSSAISGGGCEHETYSGSYDITPDTEEDIVLATADKLMSSDLTVRAAQSGGGGLSYTTLWFENWYTTLDNKLKFITLSDDFHNYDLIAVTVFKRENWYQAYTHFLTPQLLDDTLNNRIIPESETQAVDCVLRLDYWSNYYIVYTIDSGTQLTYKASLGILIGKIEGVKLL